MDFYRLLVSLLLLATVGTYATVEDYTCNHSPDQEIVRVHLKGPHAEKRAFVDQTFNQEYRVSVHYDSTFTSGLTAGVRTRIQAVINNLTAFFQTTLAVRRTPSAILLERSCSGGNILTGGSLERRACLNQCLATTTCGTATVPNDHLLRCVQCGGSTNTNDCNTTVTDGAGVASADFVLYVAASTTNCAGTTIAYAGSCQMEDNFDRPIAGYINFCSSGISGNSDDNFIFTVAKHEILHAMVFSTGLFPFFRDEDGNPRTTRLSNGDPPRINNAYSSANTTEIITINNWATRSGTTSLQVTLIITPKVVEFGRKHFNCSTLRGVQLEDQGGSGTALSHWEKRLLENEAMTGIISSNNPVFSNFTFALLEDSGWYKVNYSAAKTLVWGRGSGCGYTENSCGGYISSRIQQGKSIAPFCNYHHVTTNQLTRYGCTIDRTAISFCNLLTYTTSLPTQYQYFTSGANFDNSSVMVDRIGGGVQIADFCPYQKSFSNGICTDTSNAATGINNNRGQTFGPNSRCVEHNGQWRATGNGQISSTPFTQSGCYEYSCSNGAVTIKVLDQSYTCNQAGQIITVSQTSGGIQYTGSLVCPSCVEICYDDFANCSQAELNVPTSTAHQPSSALLSYTVLSSFTDTVPQSSITQLTIISSYSMFTSTSPSITNTVSSLPISSTVIIGSSIGLVIILILLLVMIVTFISCGVRRRRKRKNVNHNDVNINNLLVSTNEAYNTVPSTENTTNELYDYMTSSLEHPNKEVITIDTNVSYIPTTHAVHDDTNKELMTSTNISYTSTTTNTLIGGDDQEYCYTDVGSLVRNEQGREELMTSGNIAYGRVPNTTDSTRDHNEESEYI